MFWLAESKRQLNNVWCHILVPFSKILNRSFYWLRSVQESNLPRLLALAGLASRCLTARPTLQIRCRMSDVWCLICEGWKLIWFSTFTSVNRHSSHHSLFTTHHAERQGIEPRSLSQPTVFKTASSTNRTLSKKYNVWCRMSDVWCLIFENGEFKTTSAFILVFILTSYHPSTSFHPSLCE